MKKALFVILSLLITGCGSDGKVTVTISSGALPSAKTSTRNFLKSFLTIDRDEQILTSAATCSLPTLELGITLDSDYSQTTYSVQTGFIDPAELATATNSGDTFTSVVIPTWVESVEAGNDREFSVEGLFYDTSNCLNQFGVGAQSSSAYWIYGVTNQGINPDTTNTVIVNAVIPQQHFIADAASGQAQVGSSGLIEIEVFTNGDDCSATIAGADHVLSVLDVRSGNVLAYNFISAVSNVTPIYAGPLIPQREYAVSIFCPSLGKVFTSSNFEPVAGITTTVFADKI